MRYKTVPLLGFVLLALVTACGDSQTADTPTPEAKVVAKVDVEPSPTKEPPKPEPTKPPTPKLSPTKAPATAITKATELASTPTEVPPTATPNSMHRPTPPLVETVAPARVEVAQQKTEKTERDEAFWNKPMWSGLPKCNNDFKFTHPLINPEDVGQIVFGPGSHIAPHDHMAYWGLMGVGGRSEELLNPDATVTPVPEAAADTLLQVSEIIQLFAPVDIFYIDLRKEIRSTVQGDSYVEWGAYLYACNGHQLMLGHVAEPSDEIWAALEGTEPECDVPTSAAGQVGCVWLAEMFIPAGTPIFKNSGYTRTIDFGLTLAGLTAEELQEQPGYGYSITPWRSGGGSGNAVCPIGYFPEPARSDYFKLLGDFTCGPFNQDVPGTAMGFWFPSPSPEIIPLTPAERGVDEWETIWLFQDFRDSSEYIISVGNNTFGLDYGQYSYVSSGTGLVNQQWDQIESGQTYCTELKIEDNHDDNPNDINKIILIELSEDGNQLTIEAIDTSKCGEGPWEFQGGERTFYR